MTFEIKPYPEFARSISRQRKLDPEQNIPLEQAAFERRESGLCRMRNFAPVCA